MISHIKNLIHEEGFIMQNKLFKIAYIPTVLITTICMNAFAQKDISPVRIVFDKNAQRIDIMTGKQIPNYTQVQRGSIQFFLGRLDTPENGFWYYFDGRRFQGIDNMAFMRKMPTIGCWIIATDGGSGSQTQTDTTRVKTPPTVPTRHPQQNCEIWHHVISFIPLDKNGQPQPKVYVKLEDLHLIQWRPYDHWLATETQDQVEAKKGTIY